jgi:hypothetical protein
VNAIGFLFTLVAGILLFRLPRHWAFLPLLMGATYMTRGQVLELGPLNFPVVRVLATIGFLRVMARGERIAGGMNILDKMVIAWAVWLVLSSAFHTTSVLVVRVGMVWTELGNYFLFRVFVREPEDVVRIFKTVGILLLPVGALMLIEKMTGTNHFAILGGVFAQASFRHGHFRAQGPFAHAILAGTVGAMCLPMALYLWKSNRKLALLGMASAGSVVFASGSSGPVMMVFATLFALALWKVRAWMRVLLWLGLIATLALDIVMNDPVYFLMARIDITGGSTGWHRAALIQSALNRLGEWWFAGTDYTRHWMPTGIHANEVHTDITNHILQMGVWAGLPLVFLFLGTLLAAFSIVSKALRANKHAPREQQFLIWTLGAIMFGHVTNFFSISYFDQSIVYYYMLLAGVALYHGKVNASDAPVAAVNEAGDTSPHEQDLSHNR